MAEILIKGMEMPKECYSCRLVKLNKDGFLDCLLLDKACSMSSRHPDCPLVKIPAQHGRLIDANKLSFAVAEAQEKVLGKDYDPFMLLGDVLRWIDLADTVVEASK